jgi:hypothetical protein
MLDDLADSRVLAAVVVVVSGTVRTQGSTPISALAGGRVPVAIV